MRVVYEGGIYDILRVGGIARYFVDIINRMPDTFEPILMSPENGDLPISHPRFTQERIRTQAPIKLVRKFWRKAQHRRIEERSTSLCGDLIHWTYYAGLCRRPIQRGSIPSVITVYDFIYEAFPELDPSGLHRGWQRQAIESADHILCISQTTYDELCERYPFAASRASVTLLGNSFASVEAEPVSPQVASRPFVLFVGRRAGYKNFRVVWEAWQRARNKQPDLDLVVVGPPMKSRERRRLGMAHNPEGLIHLGAVSDRQLKGLYQASRAFVFPSKMEGFGLPALEAMESGTPVLASSCSALREVIGSTGYYYDADSIDSLTDLLIATGSDSLPDRAEQIHSARQRAAQFSWERTAQQTVQAYTKLLGSESTHRAA